MITEEVDKFTHVPKERLVLKPPFPEAVKIETTRRCNLSCEHCANKDAKSKGDMPSELVHSLIRESYDSGANRMGLFYLGEPFIDKNIEDYVAFAKDIGVPYVFLTTNGTLCTPDRLRRVCDAGLDSLKFSIYEDQVDTQLKAIKWLKKYDGKKPMVYGGTVGEHPKLRKKVEPYVDEFYALFKYNQGGRFPGLPNIGRIDNPVEPIPCWGMFTEAKVDWEGYMTACCFDFDYDLRVADVKEMSLNEAWHHPKYQELRRQQLEGDIKHPRCRMCLKEYIV